MKKFLLLLLLAGTGSLLRGSEPVDITDKLQSELNTKKKAVITAAGSPHYVGKTITMPSDSELFFEDGAELAAMPGKFLKIQEMLLSIRNVANVKIHGKGTIFMQRKDYLDAKRYTPGEWRHAIDIFASKNIHIDGLTLRESGGDGIYLNNGTNVVIENISAVDNLRQGISIISAENLLIKNSTFSRTDGSAPMAGIDFEPNHWSEKFINCVIENCTINDNRGAGILMSLHYLTPRTQPISITFRNCEISGNTRGLELINVKSPAVKGFIAFENCRFANSINQSLQIMGTVPNGFELKFSNTTIDNRKSKSAKILRLTPGYINGPIGNLNLGELEVIENRPNAELFAFDAYELNPLEKLSGRIKIKNGTSFDLADAVKKSSGYKIARATPPDTAKVRPLADETYSASQAENLLKVRFSGTFWQYAQKDETVKITISVSQIGKTNNAKGEVQLFSPAGKELRKMSIPVGQSDVLEFTAEETGIYQLIYNTGFQGMSFTSNRNGNGFVATNPLQSNRCAGKLYFAVPAGVEDIGVRISGDSEAELISMRLLGPDGRELGRKEKVSNPVLLRHTRPDTTKTEIYGLEILYSNDDFNFSLLGGATSIVTDSPEKVLIQQ